MQPTTTPEPRFAPTGEAGQTAVQDSATVSPMTTAKHAAPAYRITIPIVVALLLIAGVWVGGAVWSFAEQTAYAEFKHFQIPELLPLVIDGLAVAMAAVAWAASLDGRAAVAARLGAALAVAGSATSNAAWAWERATGDTGTVALAIAVPVAANIAFEVLLAEIRKQVQRWRGLPGPVPIVYPRLVGLWLSPWKTYFTWRREVLAAVDVRRQFAAINGSATVPEQGPVGGSDTPALVFLRTPYLLPAGRFRTVPDAASEPLAGTPTALRHPFDGTGADTPAATVPTPLAAIRLDTLVGVPANGSSTVFQHPDSTPTPHPDSTRTGRGAAPALTSDSTPTGTPPSTPGRDGADTPAEYPADEVLLPVLRNPARVPRELDGTVPIKRAQRVLKIGRDRAIRVLKAEGLLREPLDDTPDEDPAGTPDGTPDGTVNGSRRHPDFAGVSS